AGISVLLLRRCQNAGGYRISDANGKYISADSSQVDNFGHVMLNGAGKHLEMLVTERIGCKVRSIELNVLQRCAGHCASKTDIDESVSLGEYALKAVTEGETDKMVIIKRTSSTPYASEFELASIHEIANKEKRVPLEWINEEGNDILQPLVDYIAPLVEGEVSTEYKNGLPVYLPVDHLFK
ncbi:MAG: 6-phosphofructokinase, partial [Lachnospiraceae bacterium]|nr:6-phosphofructokinase [Lachnospiraceae bacterium]